MNIGLEILSESVASPELERIFVNPDEPEREYYLPERLDLMVTGRCILRCVGCWGPVHNAVQPEMSPEQWLSIVNYVDRNNRSDRFSSSTLASYRARVCITGGEPLMYSGLPSLAEGLYDQGTPTTLSTTGYDPTCVLPEVLPYLHELGIPLDGPTEETHMLWRKGKLDDGGFAAAMDTLLFTQQEFPGVRLTLRTMVHAGNYKTIPGIPESLHRNNIDTAKVNWKFYLFNAFTGPRKTEVDFRPDKEQLMWLADQIAKHESEFGSLDTLVPAMPQDRLVINHTGEAYFIETISASETKDVGVGNILTDPNSVISLLNNEHFDFIRYSCSRAASFAFLRQVAEKQSIA